MIENIITYLNGRLDLLNLFQATYPLCEKIDKGSRSPAPRYYCGNGEWKEVSDFDFFQGSSYWRKMGAYTATESDLRSLNASKRLVTFSLPLRLVACVPKAKLSYDDAYSESRVGLTIVKAVTAKANDLAKAIQAKRISFDVSAVETNARTILDEEYTAEINVRFEYALVSVDLNVNIDIYEDCIQGDCYDYTDDCSFLQKLVSMDKLLDCLLPEIDFSTTRAQDALTEQQEIDLTSYLCVNTAIWKFELATGNDTISITAGVDDAGTVTAQALTNADSAVYTLNAGVVTVPFAIANGDTLQIDIVRTNPALEAEVKLTGSY